MFRHFRPFLLAAVMLVTLNACNQLPDHTRYIPKDAVAVVGLNTKEIGKQIAWSALIGSKLFEEMKAKMPHEGAMEGLGNAGIKHMSTSYLYIKTDARYPDAARITALVPLDDAGKWEQYVKTTFPGASIKTVDNRKEAKLVEGMYAGWNSDLLVVMNIIETKTRDITINIQADTTEAEANASVAMSDTTMDDQSRLVVDEALLASEMQSAFTEMKDNAITGDARFKQLESAGHDITVWMNYDMLMSQNSVKLGMPAELALGSTLWKDAAFAGGFDFEKGKISGDMRYYTSEGLKSVVKEFGSKNADAELLDRLPAQNLNMMMSFYFSTKGLKELLEKIGVLGFANLALSGEGLSTDDIFEAFTGDIVASVNDFRMSYSARTVTMADSTVLNYTGDSTDVNFIYAMKIANKDKFNKLLNWLVSKELIKNNGNNTYTSSEGGPTTMIVDDNYLVVSNNAASARSYAGGNYKGQARPSIIKEKVYGHPASLYINFQSILAAIQPSQQSRADSIALTESRKLLDNLVFSGGEFKNDAFAYHFELNMVNKNENSIFQLMNFAMKLNEAIEQSGRQQTPVQAGVVKGHKKSLFY